MEMKRLKSTKRSKIRRLAERLYSKIFVQYKRIEKKGPWKPVVYNDLSGGGVGLITDEPIQNAERILLAIYLHNDPKPCTVTAKLTWCREIKPGMYKCGFKFEKTQEDTRLMDMLCEKMMDLSLDRRLI